MTPKITKDMAEAAIADGAKVKTKPTIKKPAPPKPVPIPAAEPDLSGLTGAISELVTSLKDQLNASQESLQAAQRQNDELRALATATMADKPVRLKPVRNMDRESPTYLLIEYIDVVPVTYTTRKLN